MAHVASCLSECLGRSSQDSVSPSTFFLYHTCVFYLSVEYKGTLILIEKDIVTDLPSSFKSAIYM